MDNARNCLDGSVTYAASIQDCVRQAHVLAITTPWDEFKLIYCWRLLPRRKFEAVANYLTLGSGSRKQGGKSRVRVAVSPGRAAAYAATAQP